MYRDPSVARFFHAFTNLLLGTGEIDLYDDITPENLDRALKAYIRKAMEEE